MNGGNIGQVEFGKVFCFCVSNRDANGAFIGWTPVYYDVIDPSDQTVILQDQALSHQTDRSLYFGSIDTRDSGTDATGPFEPGKTYCLVVKESLTDGPSEEPSNFQLFSFDVTAAVSAKLDRILALDGENMLIDEFVYDDSNNCTAYRIRLFDTKANASAATIDEADLEVGELYRYQVTQTFSSGVQRRLSSRGVLTGGENLLAAEKGE